MEEIQVTVFISYCAYLVRKEQHAPQGKAVGYDESEAQRLRKDRYHREKRVHMRVQRVVERHQSPAAHQSHRIRQADNPVHAPVWGTKWTSVTVAQEAV